MQYIYLYIYIYILYIRHTKSIIKSMVYIYLKTTQKIWALRCSFRTSNQEIKSSFSYFSLHPNIMIKKKKFKFQIFYPYIFSLLSIFFSPSLLQSPSLSFFKTSMIEHHQHPPLGHRRIHHHRFRVNLCPMLPLSPAPKEVLALNSIHLLSFFFTSMCVLVTLFEEFIGLQ